MADIDKILKIRTNDIKPSKGRILISEPFLMDYFFRRSVVLLAEHNEEGSFGVIVNKPIKASFNEVVKNFPAFDTQVYLGGPVQGDSIFFFHTLGNKIPGSFQILDGIYWGGEIEAVSELITMGQLRQEDIRFFIGYSGWAPDQLNEELNRNSWVVSDVNADELLLVQPKTLWETSLNRLGGDYSYWTNFPDDPTDN